MLIQRLRCPHSQLAPATRSRRTLTKPSFASRFRVVSTRASSSSPPTRPSLAWAIFEESRRKSSISSGHPTGRIGQVKVRLEQETGRTRRNRIVSYRTSIVVNIYKTTHLCSLRRIYGQQLCNLGWTARQCVLQWGHSLLVLCFYVRAMS